MCVARDRRNRQCASATSTHSVHRQSCSGNVSCCFAIPLDQSAMSLQTLQPDDIDRIRSYLELPPDAVLPLDPIQVLNQHIDSLPRTLLEPFVELTTPRDRAKVRTIKSRRIMHASTTPKPGFLSADAGRLRWPLLWERMGGSALPPPSRGVQEEERWVKDKFLGGEISEGNDEEGRDGKEVKQHVKKLGGLLRGFEEEREMENMRERKRVERRLDEVGEEFDSESDDDEHEPEGGPADSRGMATNARVVEAEDQDEVVRAFEKKLVELFVDGLDVSLPLPLPLLQARPEHMLIPWSVGELRRDRFYGTDGRRSDSCAGRAGPIFRRRGAQPDTQWTRSGSGERRQWQVECQQPFGCPRENGKRRS